jgi:hypothetical protein
MLSGGGLRSPHACVARFPQRMGFSDSALFAALSAGHMPPTVGSHACTLTLLVGQGGTGSFHRPT